MLLNTKPLVSTILTGKQCKNLFKKIVPKIQKSFSKRLTHKAEKKSKLKHQCYLFWLVHCNCSYFSPLFSY